MQILNVVASGVEEAGGRPRGFELVALEVNGESILDSEVCRKYLDTGDVVIYIDPESLIVKVSTRAVKRACGTASKGSDPT
jgi:hypothetical protein